ncbi:ribbon-helix-helix domain-containing protein [uncultured Enterovirga sp.]|uniref:ribbon-helix-helix domain-containing protein n=1 Tax=uncultured Enterovirga sp. TaxID=2026352 RepID=UPI0035CA3CB1
MTAASGGITKRSLSIAGHRTSISLEAPFWDELGRIARDRGLSVPALVAEIDAGRGAGNLSSALRVYVLEEVGARARA